MAQIRVFEFPGTITVFGLNRDQAACLLEEVEAKLARYFPGVSSVHFSRSHDRAMLARRGIDVEGRLAEDSVRGKEPPSQDELEERLARWLEEKNSEQVELLRSYAEERKQENAEFARKRARGRAKRKRDQPYNQSVEGKP